MPIYKNKIFLFSCICFLANYALESFGHFIPIYHAYGDDLLCMPVLLSLLLLFQRHIVFRNPNYTFSIWHVIVAVVYCSIVFEWWLPSRSDVYTRDWVDVVFYSIGAVIFWFGINKSTED